MATLHTSASRAHCRGVFPAALRAPRLAPCLSSSSSMLARPNSAATCTGVLWLLAKTLLPGTGRLAMGGMLGIIGRLLDCNGAALEVGPASPLTDSERANMRGVAADVSLLHPLE